MDSKRTALRCETSLESLAAVAVAAAPRLGAVEIAAAAARVRILNLVEREVRLPVVALFGERRGAVAHLDPLHAAIVELTGGVHVAEVLVAGHRAAAER